MNTIKLPVAWEICGFVDVEADTIEKVVEYFNENYNCIKLPAEFDYINGSFNLTDPDPEFIQLYNPEYVNNRQITKRNKIKELLSLYISDESKKIMDWFNGNEPYEKNECDKTIEKHERNKKLENFLEFETIDADVINNLIDFESDDELVAIYEKILEITEDEQYAKQ